MARHCGLTLLVGMKVTRLGSTLTQNWCKKRRLLTGNPYIFDPECLANHPVRDLNRAAKRTVKN